MAELPVGAARAGATARVPTPSVRSRRPPGGCWSTQGVDGLALRAVAREMGMTAPALYRYFSSREDLVENVVADLYDELCAVLEARPRRRAARRPPGVQLLDVQPRVPHLGAPRTTPSSACCSAARGRASCPTAHGRRRAPGRGWPPRPVRRRSSPSWSRRSTSSGASRSRPTTRSSRRCRSSCAPGATKLPVPLPARRHAGVPVLLDPALRHGLHGGLRAPAVRPRRRRAHVRGRAAGAGRAFWASPTTTRARRRA